MEVRQKLAQKRPATGTKMSNFRLLLCSLSLVALAALLSRPTADCSVDTSRQQQQQLLAPGVDDSLNQIEDSNTEEDDPTSANDFDRSRIGKFHAANRASLRSVRKIQICSCSDVLKLASKECELISISGRVASCMYDVK